MSSRETADNDRGRGAYHRPRGRVEQGKSGGERRINMVEAEIVRRVFREFADGGAEHGLAGFAGDLGVEPAEAPPPVGLAHPAEGAGQQETLPGLEGESPARPGLALDMHHVGGEAAGGDLAAYDTPGVAVWRWWRRAWRPSQPLPNPAHSAGAWEAGGAWRRVRLDGVRPNSPKNLCISSMARLATPTSGFGSRCRRWS